MNRAAVLAALFATAAPALAAPPTPAAPAPAGPAPAAAPAPAAVPATGAAPATAASPAPAPSPAPEAAAAPEAAPEAPPVVTPTNAPAAPAPDPRRFSISPAPVLVELEEDEPETPRGPPRRGHFHFAINADTRWHTDPSFDLFSPDDIDTAAGVSLGYGFDLGGDLAVVPELGWSGSAQSSSSLFGGGISEATLEVDRYTAGASLRLELLSFLDPHVRLSGGVADTRIALDSATGSIENEEVAPSGTLGAGFTVHTPPGAIGKRRFFSGVTFGLTAEGGYALDGAVAVTTRPRRSSGRIPVTDASLGTVEQAAPYLRIAGTVRF